MRQTRSIMGMPVQLEIIDASATQESFDSVFDYFTEVDQRFSTYKDTSEMSQLNRGEISESDCSEAMHEVLALCQKTFEETNGYFDIRTPHGILDPSGLVKGWAIHTAAELLRHKSFKNFYVEIAGDIETSGHNAEGKEWSIGVRNPFAREEVVKIIFPRGKGIATSGTYIRGMHIYNPHDPHATSPAYTSLTVVGPNIYEADRFATAAFAMGEQGMYFLEGLEGFEAYAIDSKGIAHLTSGFEAYTLL
jgi:thiamine biosynthesis lipoprotein